MLIEQPVVPPATVVTRPIGPGDSAPGAGKYETIRAVLFDMDGTLYNQGRLRRAMALELAAFAIRRPFQAPRAVRVLAEFRKAQEFLRGKSNCRPVDQMQIAAERARTSLAGVQAIVDEWMFERPL